MDDDGPSAALAFLDACPTHAGVVILADWEEDARLGRQACLARGLVPQKNASARTVGYLCIPSAAALVGVAAIRANKMRDKGATIIDWGATVTSPLELGSGAINGDAGGGGGGGGGGGDDLGTVIVKPKAPKSLSTQPDFLAALTRTPPAAPASVFVEPLPAPSASDVAASAAAVAETWSQLPITTAGTFLPLDLDEWAPSGLPFDDCPPVRAFPPVSASDLPPDCKRPRTVDIISDFGTRVVLPSHPLVDPETRQLPWVPYPTRPDANRIAHSASLRGCVHDVTVNTASNFRDYTVSLAHDPSSRHSVLIGSRVMCSCGAAHICAHRCFVFCRVLHVAPSSPLIFQNALLARERSKIFRVAPDRREQQRFRPEQAECVTCCEALGGGSNGTLAADPLRTCDVCGAQAHVACFRAVTQKCTYCSVTELK